jgi:hypothetical protein
MTMTQKIIDWVTLVYVAAAASLFLTLLPGCGSVLSYMPDPGTPTCKEVQAHITDVGCLDVEVCNTYIETIKREFIYSKLPKGVPFDIFCDFAVSKLPTDCVMEAQDPQGIIKCVDEYVKK